MLSALDLLGPINGPRDHVDLYTADIRLESDEALLDTGEGDGIVLRCCRYMGLVRVHISSGAFLG